MFSPAVSKRAKLLSHARRTLTEMASISMITYNLLSPGYFRKLDRSSKKRMEASHAEAWIPRIKQQSQVLADLGAELIAVQELWFKDRVFSILQEQLPQYECIKAQRSGSKEDGVALYYKSTVFRCCASSEIAFKDDGDRCIVLALLELRGPATGQPARMIAATTHLTYPHDEHDCLLRVQQSRRILAEVSAFAQAHGAVDVPVLLAGDFNGCDDAALQVLTSEGGFVSCFREVHGRHPGATHLDHVGSSAPVDAVFLRHGSPQRTAATGAASVAGAASTSEAGAQSATASHAIHLRPREAFLLPTCAPDDTQLCRPVPQTKDTLDWLAKQAQTQAAPETETAAGQGASCGTEAAGQSCAACAPGSSARHILVPPILDSPAALSSTHSNGAGPWSGLDSAAASTHSQPVCIPPMLIPLATSREEHGPWYTPGLGDASPGRPSSKASTEGTGAADAGQAIPAGSVVNGRVEPEYVGVFAVSRPLSELTLADFCNLSDHRPLVVKLDVLAP